MKLLAHRVLGGFAAFSVFRCQRSIGLRSIHLAPACCAPAAGAGAAVKDQRWVMLDRRDCRRSDSLAADGETLAECSTSMGRRLRVSFGVGLSPPPASSFLSYNCAGTAPDDKDGDDDEALQVIAAHGDSVLLQMRRCPREASRWSRVATTFDHFVYRAGGGAARPPSLSLLPPRNIPTWREEEGMAGAGIRDPHCRPLLDEDTGVLRRGLDDGGGGDGELLVVQLELMPGYSEERYGTADLCVLRHGRSSSVWEKRRSVPILHDEGDELPGPLAPPAMAIPVGDRFLCWVCYRGFILCDMADEASPKLRYIRRPGSPFDSDPDYHTDDLPPLSDSRGMGAAAAAAVRFVAVEPRCCCGGFGRSSCPRSRFAFTVTTWTMNLTMEKTMAWVKDAVMDCEELWALPGYEGIPRVHLREPVVSLDNPDVVCFKVADRKPWMIQVDTRKKELLAAVQCTINNPWRTKYYLPAKLQR